MANLCSGKSIRGIFKEQINCITSSTRMTHQSKRFTSFTYLRFDIFGGESFETVLVMSAFDGGISNGALGCDLALNNGGPEIGVLQVVFSVDLSSPLMNTGLAFLHGQLGMTESSLQVVQNFALSGDRLDQQRLFRDNDAVVAIGAATTVNDAAFGRRRRRRAATSAAIRQQRRRRHRVSRQPVDDNILSLHDVRRRLFEGRGRSRGVVGDDDVDGDFVVVVVVVIRGELRRRR